MSDYWTQLSSQPGIAGVGSPGGWPGVPTLQSGWADAGAYIDPRTGRLTVPSNRPPLGSWYDPSQVPGAGGFGGGFGGGGGEGMDAGARAAAEAERAKALGMLEGRNTELFGSPVSQAMMGALPGMISGADTPFSQSVQNQMFSSRADQIGAAAAAARQRAATTAGAAGLGRGTFYNKALQGVGTQAAGARQEALRDVQMTAVPANYAARQQSMNLGRGVLGTLYGITNPLVQQAASMRFNTQFRGGAGGGGGAGGAGGGVGGIGTFNPKVDSFASSQQWTRPRQRGYQGWTHGTIGLGF